MFPKSFNNEIVSNNKNVFKEISGDLKTIHDIDKWIFEYQMITITELNVRRI